jgi:peptidoglycan/LPS O-acetylase OafA/YrhL
MERETALPRGDYMPQLDGLRALAVGCVLIAHFVVPLARFPFGSVGVFLFFVLSGYLITGILLRARDDAEREGTSRLFALRQFYIRRFLRIFPLYYLVLTLAALANAGEARKMVWWNAAYLSNFYMAAHGWQHPVSHFWTLAVEEQFYIAWPWVVMFLPWRLVAPVVSAAIAVPLLWKLAVTHATGNLFAAGILTPSCLDTLGAGSLLAIAARAGRPRPPSWMLWLGLPLVAAGVVLFHHNQEQIAWSILMGYGMALTGVWLVGRGALGFEGPIGRILSLRPLMYLGSISYGIYIWHNFMPWALGHWGSRLHFTGARSFATWLLGTLLLSAASSYFFEKPINNLKRFFPYSRARRDAARRTEGPLEYQSARS